MSIVVIYSFSGRYSGSPEYEYNHPELGATHKCLLFMRQHADTDEYESAGVECKKYGFGDITFSRRGALQVEVLNTDAYRGFSGFYEQALHAGTALVYYPN